MTKLSTFQTLPYHVIENAVSYTVDTHLSKNRRNTDYGLHILHSCHRWRTALIKNLLKSVSIKLFNSANPDCVFGAWPTSIGFPQFPAAHLVKNIKFYYREWEPIRQPTAVDLFEQTVFPDSTFSSASQLEVFINFIGTFDTPETMETLRQILFSLKRMAPNLKKMLLLAGHIMAPLQGSNTAGFLQSIVTEYIADIKDLNIRISFPKIINYFNPAQFTGITNLSFDCFRDPRSIEIMVRSNAATLQHLRMADIWTNCFQTMLHKDGQPIVYPELKSMYLRFTAECNDQTVYNVVHFPRLTKLSIISSYLVYSQALFTNTGSLEYLDMSLMLRTIEALDTKKLFTDSQFGNLKTLMFSNVDRIRDLPQMSGFINHMLCLPQSLARLHIQRYTYNKDTLSSLMALPAPVFANIGELLIDDKELDISEAIAMLQKAPRVRKFNISISNVNPSINGIFDVSSNVDYIRSNLSPINQHVYNIRISNCPYKEVVRFDSLYIAYLIAGCPRLSHVFMRRFGNTGFVESLRALADDDAFAPYKQHIDLVVRNYAVDV